MRALVSPVGAVLQTCQTLHGGALVQRGLQPGEHGRIPGRGKGCITVSMHPRKCAFALISFWSLNPVFHRASRTVRYVAGAVVTESLAYRFSRATTAPATSANGQIVADRTDGFPSLWIPAIQTAFRSGINCCRMPAKIR